MVDALTEIENLLSFYGKLSPKIACIWLSLWAIRRKADADYALDSLSSAVRWTVVVVGFIFGYVAPLKPVRVIAGVVGLVFLCWPNCAYHLTGFFRRWSLPQDLP